MAIYLLNKLHLKKDMLFISVLAVFAIAFNMLDGYAGDIGNGLLRFLCIILLCPVLLWLEKFTFISEKIKSFLGWFGKYTLELYMLHMLIFLAVYKTLGNTWGGVLSIIISICIAPIIQKLINNIIQRLNINFSKQ